MAKDIVSLRNDYNTKALKRIADYLKAQEVFLNVVLTDDKALKQMIQKVRL